MNTVKWLKENTASLVGKTVAITGSTGGLGQEICRYILKLGGSLVLIDRNPEKSLRFEKKLKQEFNNADIYCIIANLEDINSVKAACNKIKKISIDIFIHNAGAYSIPRKISNTGLDNVFTINFAAPYYITKQLLPSLKARKGRVVVVGSIAHNYGKTDPDDIDFKSRKKPSLVYGNSKRYLMFSMFELLKSYPEIKLSVVHPGITFTNITSHYPKWLFAIIKNPMKVIFMPPRIAALSIIKGIFTDTEYFTWIGPKFFNVWGKPRKKKLKTCAIDESRQIFENAEKIYEILIDKHYP